MSLRARMDISGADRQLCKGPSNLPEALDVQLRETHPEVRAWNLSAADIRQGGALFNVMKGARFGDLGTPMLLVLWPGYGVRSAGLHMGGTPAGARGEVHTHPTSDECLCNWVGRGEADCDGEWMEEDALDVLLAPCGVPHSVGGPRDLSAGPSYGCGFASPPQLDLYVRTPFHHAGSFEAPPWSTLSTAPANGVPAARRQTLAVPAPRATQASPLRARFGHRNPPDLSVHPH